MDIQIISVLIISLFFAFIIFLIKKFKRDVIKYAKYKYFIKGILSLCFGGILLFGCAAGCYFIFSEFITGEKLVSGDDKLLKLIEYALLITAIFAVYSLRKGFSDINTVIMKDKLFRVPEKMEFPINVSRLKFLYAAILNPLEISFKTAFSFYLLFLILLILVYSPAPSYIEKIIILLIGICIEFAFEIFAIIQYNKLYTSMKKGNVVTILSEQGVSRKTGNLLIITTPWHEVEAVKFFKDYAAILSKDSDYWIFTKDKAQRDNIKMFYEQSRYLGNIPIKRDATFVETEKLLKEMALNSIAFCPDENFKLKPYSSKIGGNPFVPESFAYEYPAFYTDNENDDKRGFTFLAQINCKDAFKYDKTNILPKTGILYFFCDIDSELGYVYYYDGDLNKLKELELPQTVPFKLDEYWLKISNEQSLPCYDDFVQLVNNGYSYDVEAYYTTLHSVYEELNGRSSSLPAGMLGYADLIYDSVMKDLAITNDKELRENNSDIFQDWVLLFQMQAEETYVRCYFYIKREDLKIRNFSNIFFSLQEY